MLQLLHVSQFLSSFIHCWCMRETTSQFCGQFITCEFIAGQDHLSHSSCGLLEDLSPDISITCSAGLVDFVDPLQKPCLFVPSKILMDGSEHCVICFVSAGSCQLLKCFLLTLLAGSHYLQGSGLDIGQFHQCCTQVLTWNGSYGRLIVIYVIWQISLI